MLCDLPGGDHTEMCFVTYMAGITLRCGVVTYLAGITRVVTYMAGITLRGGVVTYMAGTDDRNDPAGW